MKHYLVLNKSRGLKSKNPCKALISLCLFPNICNGRGVPVARYCFLPWHCYVRALTSLW